MSNNTMSIEWLKSSLGEYRPIYIFGIYFLLDKSEIVYIGKSVDIVSRVQSHHREENKKFDSVLYLDCNNFFSSTLTNWWLKQGIHGRNTATDLLTELEAHLINLYKPLYNRSVPKIVPKMERLRSLIRCATDSDLSAQAEKELIKIKDRKEANEKARREYYIERRKRKLLKGVDLEFKMKQKEKEKEISEYNEQIRKYKMLFGINEADKNYVQDICA